MWIENIEIYYYIINAKKGKTDEGIKVRHGLTFWALYSLSNVVIVAFYLLFKRLF